MLRAVLLALVVIAAESTFAYAQDESRYDEMLKSPAHATTVRSLGTAMLAFPFEQESAIEQIERVAWFNKDGLELSKSVKELEATRLRRQIHSIRTIVEARQIRQLSLVGFSQVGTKENIDLYFAADTDQGPVMIRASIAFPETGARVFGFELFDGWGEVRAAMDRVEHRAGRSIAAVTYTPKTESRSDSWDEKGRGTTSRVNGDFGFRFWDQAVNNE